MKTAIRTDTAIRNDGALLESQELTKYTLEVMSLENDVAFTALLRASFMILHKMFPKSPKARMAATMQRYTDEFERRVAFAYSVLDPDSDEVIGCVYIDPSDRDGNASVRSWVRADVAELDAPLRKAVRDWLTESWPFNDIEYAGG